MRRALLQVADTGPLESLVVMLRAVGYECYLPSDELRSELRELGGLVLAPRDLQRGMGYEKPMELPEADSVRGVDLFVDVKAHQTHDRLVREYPNLEKRVLWYRINGGRPEVVPGCGDEVDPPCPVLTPNQWYKLAGEPTWSREEYTWIGSNVPTPWRKGLREGRFYVCWPPFRRFHLYGPREQPRTAPICLVHNVNGWGYGALVPSVRDLGVKVYGDRSPDGLLHHATARHLLKSALAYVHLKSNDAPGYALYEALASACPVVCTRRLVWRCRMHELLAADDTCLVFDRETHDGLSAEDVENCTTEVARHLDRLADSAESLRIGNAGQSRLRKLMWDEKRDAQSFADFLARNFP